MMESADTVDLRIRFAGLCLFVPDRTNRFVHVLMPPTGGHDHQGHGGEHVEPHLMRVYWVNQGQPRWAPLDGRHLVLRGPDWKDPDLDIKDVFDLGKIAPSGECPEPYRGRADPAGATTRMELHAGKSKVINRGARWKISNGDGKKHGMPTVLDWRVSKARRGDVNAMLQGWGVFPTLPEPDSKGTVNLWILHLPKDEQKPWEMTSTPEMNVGMQHFSAYYSLLVCRGAYDAKLAEPEPEDVENDADRPEWPVLHAAQGMLVTCMVAKAELASS